MHIHTNICTFKKRLKAENEVVIKMKKKKQKKKQHKQVVSNAFYVGKLWNEGRKRVPLTYIHMHLISCA